jgi:hypothetical protein
MQFSYSENVSKWREDLNFFSSKSWKLKFV